MKADNDTIRLPPPEVARRIATLTGNMMSFWNSAHGWAPIEAAGLLNKAMLEWQASLSDSLSKWLRCSSDGDLILAWANLGALVEGQLKLFLSVFFNDYSTSTHAIRDKKGALQEPGVCTIEPLRKLFVRSIWTVGDDWNDYVLLVQQRRNAIHAFTSRNIGTFAEWRNELRRHLSFIRDINGRLPYPERQYVPQET
jgi:hypothetical protein